MPGIRNEGGMPLLHETAYYTLNEIPAGKELASGVKVEKKANTVKQSTAAPVAPKNAKEVSEVEAMALLKKHTCLSCHAKDTKVVGPSYVDISKRKYSEKRILELVYKPEPENWPEFATPMAPMSHVPSEDVIKIARWINSLNQPSQKLLNRD